MSDSNEELVAYTSSRFCVLGTWLLASWEDSKEFSDGEFIVEANKLRAKEPDLSPEDLLKKVLNNMGFNRVSVIVEGTK